MRHLDFPSKFVLSTGYINPKTVHIIGQRGVGREIFNSRYSIKFDYIISILIALEESSLIILSLIKSKWRCF